MIDNPKAEILTLNKQRGVLAALALVALCLCGPSVVRASPGVETDPGVWEPIPLDDIRAVHENRDLSDIEIVRILSEHLDQRISMSRLIHTTKVKANPPQEYGTLIRLIAERPYPAEPKGRPEAIVTVVESLGSLKNTNEVRSYLYLALGLAKGTPPEREILDVLENPETPKEIIEIALDSMSRSHVPIRSLPRLLQLSEDPTNYVQWRGVGAPDPRRIYPIRERVYDCLLRLNIKCEKIAQEDKQIDPIAERRLSTTSIKVDRRSLQMRLRTWLLDHNPDVWQPTMDAVARISAEDVDNLVNELALKGMLSAEKLRYLRN